MTNGTKRKRNDAGYAPVESVVALETAVLVSRSLKASLS